MLIAIAAALAVVVIAVAAWAGLRSDDSDTANDPAPTQPTSTEPSTSPTDEPSPTEPSTEPTSEPTSAPTSVPTLTTPTAAPTEQRRTVPDVDSGTAVYDDVYLQPAAGWVPAGRRTTFVTSVGRSGHGIYRVIVLPFGLSARSAATTNTASFAKALKVAGLTNGAGTVVAPPNANIASGYRTNFTGRISTNSRTVSVVGHCTALTGVASIHNVTAVACLVAPLSTAAASNRDATQMLGSVARSI